MSDYEIIDTNAENIGICSFCGYKKASSLGHRRKTDWLKERYAEGLRFKVLRSPRCGDIGMIEYALGNHAWRPVEAAGYLVIHCLMVNAKHKGQGLGRLLLDSCLRDARKLIASCAVDDPPATSGSRKFVGKRSNHRRISGAVINRCRGVAVVTSADSFMAGSDFFLKAGFVAVDSLPPYELLVKKLKKGAPDPRFRVDRERLLKRHKKGLTILAADQCPMVAKCVADVAKVAEDLGLKPKVVRVRSAAASRQLPTPYGVFCILYDGKVIAGRPVSGTRFRYIMREIAAPAEGAGD